MNITEFKEKVKYIVETSYSQALLNKKHTNLPVNYACIFSHSESEYDELISLASQIGKNIKDTYSGPIFHIKEIETEAGNLKLLKIRQPDSKKEGIIGYADFTVPNFEEFKSQNLSNSKYYLFDRENYEIIGLDTENSDVETYFANPPLDVQLGVR